MCVCVSVLHIYFIFILKYHLEFNLTLRQMRLFKTIFGIQNNPFKLECISVIPFLSCCCFNL